MIDPIIVGCLLLWDMLLFVHESALHISFGVSSGMIFRREPFFNGMDNADQLVKIARV